MRQLGWVLFAGIFSAAPEAACSQQKPAPPFSAEESRKRFQLPKGLEIKLVAKEPQVVDPVAFAFDEHRRLWVAEMRDYPNGPNPGQPPRSRIRLLRDRNNDGFYETATTFADRLPFANGVMPWKGGVIVTLAGKIVWMKDTTGDDKADVKQTWFEGFAEQNPQLRANDPTLGPDGKIYVANGLRGGFAKRVGNHWKGNRPAKVISLRGKDFRFDPQTGVGEAVSGNGQFGMDFDEAGGRYLCDNRHPFRQVLFQQDDLARNPLLRVDSVVHDVSPGGENSRVFPLTKAWTTSNLHSGQFTACCGVISLELPRWGKQYQRNAFTCEPTGNLVHRSVLSPAGATWSGRPGRKGVEFLASTDSWFRPVFLAAGPHADLYVADMYRAVIEHPQFMPTELKNRPDLVQGNTRGRIWAIRNRIRVADRHSFGTDDAIIAALASQKVWERETAFRLLIERDRPRIVSAIGKLPTTSRSSFAIVRALRVLAVKNALTAKHLLAAAKRSDSRIAQTALDLSGPLLKSSRELQNWVGEQILSRNSHIRFRAILAASHVTPPADWIKAMAASATAKNTDEWTRKAVLIAATRQRVPLLRALLSAKPNDDIASMIAELCRQIGVEHADGDPQAALVSLLGEQNSRVVRAAGIRGLHEGAKRKGSGISNIARLLPKSATKRLAEVWALANATAASPTESEADRLRAMQLLAVQAGEEARKTLRRIAVAPKVTPRIRVAAIDLLSANLGEAEANKLLDRFLKLTPSEQRALLRATVRNRTAAKRLLGKIKSGAIPFGLLDTSSVRALQRHRDAAIRAMASSVLKEFAVPKDRAKVIADYQAALSLKSDTKRGLAVFRKVCATCHKVGKFGINVGPEISDTRTKKPAALLQDILHPNRAIDANFVMYAVRFKDGRSDSGLLVAETGEGITLKKADGKLLRVARDDISQFKNTGKSMMPDGLERQLTKQQMADLLDYLKNWRYMDGRTPLGKSR